MEHESGFEILTGGIVYPFTDGSRLFWGGVAGLLSFVMIGIPFILGYQVRCGRNILEGNDDLPGWEDLDRLFFDGIFAFVILILYGIVSAVVTYGLFFVALLAGFSILDDSALLLYMIALMVLVFLVTLPLSVLSQISLMNFIYTGNLGTGLNPVNSVRLLLSRPLEFVKALVLDYVANLIIAIPFFALVFGAALLSQGCGACMFLIVVMLSFGWVIFIQNTARLFIWIKYFARVVEDKPDTSFDPSLVA